MLSFFEAPQSFFFLKKYKFKAFLLTTVLNEEHSTGSTDSLKFLDVFIILLIQTNPIRIWGYIRDGNGCCEISVVWQAIECCLLAI